MIFSSKKKNVLMHFPSSLKTLPPRRGRRGVVANVSEEAITPQPEAIDQIAHLVLRSKENKNIMVAKTSH